jgi:hypothetical protein
MVGACNSGRWDCVASYSEGLGSSSSFLNSSYTSLYSFAMSVPSLVKAFCILESLFSSDLDSEGSFR